MALQVTLSEREKHIDFDEFLAMMRKYEVSEVDELRQAFSVFDKDGDGSISAKELEIVMKALGEPIDRQTIDLMIESVDTVSTHERNNTIVGSLDFVCELLLILSTLHSSLFFVALSLSLSFTTRVQDKSGFIDFDEFRQMMKDGPVELSKD